MPENKLADGLKKVLLAGVGAAATVAEKTEEVVGDLVKKGELTVEQGKVANEELKRNAEKHCDELIHGFLTLERIMEGLAHLTPAERLAVKARLEELELEEDAPDQDEETSEDTNA